MVSGCHNAEVAATRFGGLQDGEDMHVEVVLSEIDAIATSGAAERIVVSQKVSRRRNTPRRCDAGAAAGRSAPEDLPISVGMPPVHNTRRSAATLSLSLSVATATSLANPRARRELAKAAVLAVPVALVGRTCAARGTATRVGSGGRLFRDGSGASDT